MPNAAFGIDHPLLATNDITALRQHFTAMGFNMTAIGRHPWGTSTTLAMFDGCLIELMGIFDANLIDEKPAGDFRFGRHVHAHLSQREGVALTALHSADMPTDVLRAKQAGLTVAGQLEFGREVTLPDGTAGRTKTTLALLPNAAYPRLSFFLCQQHRPDLIYVPDWLRHPNTAHGFHGIHVVAEASDHKSLADDFTALYGPAVSMSGECIFQTANGVLHLMRRQDFVNHIAPLPAVVMAEKTPAIVGMDIAVTDPEVLCRCLDQGAVAYERAGDVVTLTDPALTANTVLRFMPG